MTTLTLRLDERQERLMNKVKEVTGKKAATKAILAALDDYVKIVSCFTEQRNTLQLAESELRALVMYRSLSQWESTIQDLRMAIRRAEDHYKLVDY